MKHRAVVRLSALCSALTVTMASAQSTGPYYATPSWDQTLPDASRFVLLSNFGNDAVLDRNTGLVWQRSPLGATSLDNAIDMCMNARSGNHYGWRVPALVEMQTVLDNSYGPSTFPPPPFAPANFRYYATSTLVSTNSGHYWLLWASDSGSQKTFEADRAVSYTNGFPMMVLCVRGPAGNG